MFIGKSDFHTFRVTIKAVNRLNLLLNSFKFLFYNFLMGKRVKTIKTSSSIRVTRRYT